MRFIAGASRPRILLALFTWYAIWIQGAAGLTLGSNPTTSSEIATTDSEGSSVQATSPKALNDHRNNVSIESSVVVPYETSRRSMIGGGMGTLSVLASLVSFPDPSFARAPGSKDVVASIQQIQDASKSLKTLQANWEEYASIDEEGRARSTDGARRILGGIAPQAGAAAIDAAKNTPLYRIDVAFVTVRKAVLEGSDKNDPETAWRDKLDLERFEELADRVIYGNSKADGNFYSVLFAMKGTTMITDIFVETKKLVQQGIDDLDNMVLLLQEAGAPGV